MNICTFPDCGRALYAKGLCQTHYTQQRKGKPLAPIQPQRGGRGPQRICSHVGCERVARAKGFCHSHYRQWRETGETGPLLDPRRGRGVCTIDGCQGRQEARGWCAKHYRALWVRFQKYNVSREYFEAMLGEQSGQCAICRGQLDVLRARIDHDHRCCPGQQACGRCVRGLLCVNCNTGIGMLQDDPVIAEAAAAYLRSHSG